MDEFKIRQMLLDLAEPVLRILSKATGSDEGQLRELWQQEWGRACDECGGT